MENTLEDILHQWQSYHQALQKVNTTLSETEYALQRYNSATGDIASFTEQLNQLKVK